MVYSTRLESVQAQVYVGSNPTSSARKKSKIIFMKRNTFLLVFGLVALGSVIGWFLSSYQTKIPTQISAKCGLEGCHGLDVTCGSKVAEMCDEMYALGDGCRQFVKCGKTDGACQMVESEKFLSCKSCVKECQVKFTDEDIAMSQCESGCIGNEEDLINLEDKIE